MTEHESKEVGKVLLHLADACDRTRATADRLEASGGAAHLVAALRATEKQLREQHRTLSQATYWAV